MQELNRYWQKLSGRRWLLAIISFAVTATVMVVGFTLPKSYRADSTVFIEENIIKGLVKGIAVTSDLEAELRVLKNALTTRAILRKALDKVDMDLLPGGTKNVDNEFIETLQKDIQISVKGKDLFTVSLKDENPKFAYQFISALVSTYVEENSSTQRQQTYGAERFLVEQMNQFKAKLDKAEDEIIAFRKSRGTFMTMSDTMVLADLKRLAMELEGAETELGKLEAKEASLSTQLATLEKTLPMTTTSQATNTRLSALETRLAVLRTKYTDSHPEVVQAQELIAREKANGEEKQATQAEMVTYNPVYTDNKQKLTDVQAELSSLRVHRKKLQSLIAAKEADLKNIPESQKQLRQLEQERDSAKKIYEDLMARAGQAEVSKQMEIGDKTINFRIVDPAILNYKPVWPNPYLVVLAAVILGLGSGFGITLLLSSLHPVIFTIADAENEGLEILSVVPVIRQSGTGTSAVFANRMFWSLPVIYFLSVALLVAIIWMRDNHKAIPFL